MDNRAWKQSVLDHRAGKDSSFARDPASPVAGKPFRRLNYYPIDPAYRLVLPLEVESPEHVIMPRTGGDEVEYLRVGTFQIDVPGGGGTLAAHRSAAHGHDLWVPFRDVTNGKETYGAGRYLEATPLRDGRWQLDFNLAYHPFCAYNENYSCPLVPGENHINFALTAGEKL